MKTLTRPRFTNVAFASIAAVGLVLTGWPLLRPVSLTWPLAHEVNVPAVEVPPALQLLPFTFRDTVHYFQDALAQFPNEVRANEVVFRGGNHRDNFYSITVVSYGSDILVKFDVMDDYGMTLLREFFEAPFFQRRESEQFYALLDGRNVTKSIRLPRFDVVYEYDGRGESAAIISMLFSPRVRTTNEESTGQ